MHLRFPFALWNVGLLVKRFFVRERLRAWFWGRKGLERKVITVPLVFLLLAWDHEVMQRKRTGVIRGIDRLEGVEAECMYGWKGRCREGLGIGTRGGCRGRGGVRRTS